MWDRLFSNLEGTKEYVLSLSKQSRGNQIKLWAELKIYSYIDRLAFMYITDRRVFIVHKRVARTHGAEVQIDFSFDMF